MRLWNKFLASNEKMVQEQQYILAIQIIFIKYLISFIVSLLQSYNFIDLSIVRSVVFLMPLNILQTEIAFIICLKSITSLFFKAELSWKRAICIIGGKAFVEILYSLFFFIPSYFTGFLYFYRTSAIVLSVSYLVMAYLYWKAAEMEEEKKLLTVVTTVVSVNVIQIIFTAVYNWIQNPDYYRLMG